MTLLSRAGEANGVRTAWYRGTGIATVVGMPVDLETVEVLFTSLLVQAGRALNIAGAVGGAHARSAAFRRSFLLVLCLADRRAPPRSPVACHRRSSSIGRCRCVTRRCAAGRRQWTRSTRGTFRR